MSEVAMVVADRVSAVVTELEPESAIALRSAFDAMFAQADEWAARAKSIQVTSLDDKRGMKLARESRLALREIRVKAEHTRKRLKEDSTRRGKAIDGIANVLKALIEPIEEHLLVQETFAERHEAAQRSALQAAREETLRALGMEYVSGDLGVMSEEVWTATLDDARAAHEARLEAARVAEAARVEAARVAAEKAAAERAARAKAEAERVERERVAREEAARLAAENAALEARAKVEREAARRAQAQADAELQAARAETERTAKALRDAERARLAEVAAQEARERAEREAQEAAARAAAAAPDREKLLALAAQVRGLVVPTMATERGQKAAQATVERLGQMADWLTRAAGAL
jgi:hypothetical protein